MDVMPFIARNLSTNNDLEYQEFNPKLYHSRNKLRTWMEQVSEIFSEYTFSYKKREISFSDLNIDLQDFLLNPQKYRLSQSK
jgi:hypothetical protein